MCARVRWVTNFFFSEGRTDDETFLRWTRDFSISHKQGRKNDTKAKSAQKQKKFSSKLFEQLEEMLGFITNRLLNALNVTYAPYASCKALMSVTPDDDIKW